MKHLRGLCHHCGGGIEFPAEGIGSAAPCPHCGQETELTLAPLKETPESSRNKAWAVGGLIVLVLLLMAAFVSLHLLRKLAPRAKPPGAAVAPTVPANPGKH